MKKRFLTAVLFMCCLSANAYDTYYSPDDAHIFQYNVYHPGESVKVTGDKLYTAFYIPQKYIEPLLLSGESWSEKLNIAPIKSVIYSYTSINDYNASAGSPPVTVAELPFEVSETNAILHNWTITTPQQILDTTDGNGVVMIGLGINEVPGWQPYTGKHPLYHDELPDLYPIMVHEMMHSLGLSSSVEKQNHDGEMYYFFSEGNTVPLSIFDSQLRIYKGFLNPIIDPMNEIAPMRGPSEGDTQAEVEARAVGKGMGFDVETYSPYFIGQNTLKVLGDSDDYNTARQNIVNNGGIVNYSDYYYDNKKPYPKVYGLPIHPSDGENPEGEMTYDLSHFELRNSYMSHQDFRNWLVPMEAELAFMNDIGYNIDLKKYFGKSYYLNNTVCVYDSGFSEWDGQTYTGKPSTIDQAVGIHIYGNNNNITQTTRDISMLGEGSIGVRIDGTNNTYTLESGNIKANGKENLGIAVTWGSGHNVNVVEGTNVTASGQDGIAASFDFGSNLFGTKGSNIKGSFINYSAAAEYNLVPDIENQGALVEKFNVNGNLEGEKAAIYISDNAYVKNININDGVQIKGDIISEWNSIMSLNKALVLKFDGTEWRGIDFTNPDEILYTNLKFNGADGITVDGDIIGDQKLYNTLKMSNEPESVLNFNGNNIDVNSLNNNGEINISKEINLSVIQGEIKGNGQVNILNGAGLNILNGINNIENKLSFDNASFSTVNNIINEISVSGMELNGQNTFAADVDLKTLNSDKLIFNNPNDLIVNDGSGFRINNINLMNINTALTNKNYYIPFISQNYKNENLIGNITFNANKDFLTPIFKYNLGYEENNTGGGFTLNRGELKKYNSYNPAVTVAPVAAQMGGYISQLNSYEQAFRNLDMKMLMTRKEREALRMANSYASIETPKVFSPIYLPEKDNGCWFRPYAAFEKVGLNNGPKVENISYGSYFGGDSPVFTTKNGWDYQYSVYAGYNGSHQNYSTNSIYQNGGNIGATGIWYKGDFFTALTANVGAGAADATTMYGNEDFPILMSGVASKTGYNWELSNGKFIIQPSYLMSYTFVNTFDYKNAAGIRINSEPLNAINISPGLKFIGNLKNGWQPYAGIQMVWNIMDKTDFRANNVALPDMSVKPYVQYGIGLQKRWGDRFTGFFQTMIRNGGRNGVALSAGFRWAIGK